MAKCACCGEPNMGAMLTPELEEVCWPCVEEGAAALCEDTGVYLPLLECRCGNRGPANYCWQGCWAYYCGGNQYCMP